jgi:hypothetical protein
MEILVAILIIALVAAVAYAVIQQRKRTGIAGPGRPHESPLPRRSRTAARHDPMADAVAEHAQATHPADVVAAEQRLQAQARSVAAGMQPGAYGAGQQAYAPGQPGSPGPAVNGAPVAGAAPGAAFATDPSLDDHFDPVTGERIDGFGDPANDPRYNDPRYDGRLAADWVDPRDDDRAR